MSDHITTTTLKSSIPSVSVSEGSHSTVESTKELHVNMENLGEDNVPDLSLFKYNEDVKSILEYFAKQPQKNISEQSTLSELFSRTAEFQRLINESTSVTDAISTTWNAVRYFEDDASYLIVNYVEGDYVKGTPGVFEIFSASPNKVINETTTLVESISHTFNLNINETLLSSESVSYLTTYNISLTDYVTYSEFAIDTGQEAYGEALPNGYFQSNYGSSTYAKENVGYETINIREVVTTTLGQ